MYSYATDFNTIKFVIDDNQYFQIISIKIYNGNDELSIEEIFKAILKKETNLILGTDFVGGEVWLLPNMHVEDLEQESIKFFRIEG